MVYEALRDDLLASRIGVIERLGEERLAERFRVSRTPVREALARLRADGLLERRDGGLYPQLPAFDQLRGLYELRLTLELRGIQRALEDPSVRHDDEALAREMARWEAFRDSRPIPSASFVYEDERFHLALLQASGNAALAEALQNVNQRIRGVRMRDYLDDIRIEATIEQHIEILDLLLRRRLITALDALRAHVSISAETVIERASQSLAILLWGEGGRT
jgi:DNA-binding GntR family transcriptional regulator